MLIHLAIVSDQFLPTVIPALMRRPGRMVLIASQKMQAKAERLKQILANHGIPAIIRGSAPDSGIHLIRDYAVKQMARLAHTLDGHEVVFNATGGNKLMTLGFVEALRDRVDRIIYTDTAHDQIEVIHDRHRPDFQPEPMRQVLDVPTYLAIQGFQYHSCKSDDPSQQAQISARRPVAQTLAGLAAQDNRIIGYLNKLAHQAMDKAGQKLVAPAQHVKLEEAWRQLFTELAGIGLIEWDGERTLRFQSLEAARFLGGGWLEEYAYLAAKATGLYDVRLGVEGIWEKTMTARNEFDVLACHCNRMLFIECKTGKWGDQEQDNDNITSYKLESLSENIRGVFGATMLITAQQPTQVLRDRAKRAKVRLIEPQSLPKLSDLIIWWRDQGPKVRQPPAHTSPTGSAPSAGEVGS